MEKKFRATLKYGDDYSFLKISGVIDEDNTLQEITSKIQGKYLVIHLSEVERINSCGVRDWVNWLSEIEKKNHEVVLLECSPSIVSQINLVNNFTGHGKVINFFAPYYCQECDLEKVKLIEVDAFKKAAKPTAPPFHWEGCDKVQCHMEFDDIEESYFAFVQEIKNFEVNEELQSIIHEGQTRLVTPTSNILSRTQTMSMQSRPGTGSSEILTDSGVAGGQDGAALKKSIDVEKYANILLYLIIGGMVVLLALIVYFMFQKN